MMPGVVLAAATLSPDSAGGGWDGSPCDTGGWPRPAPIPGCSGDQERDSVGRDMLSGGRQLRFSRRVLSARREVVQVRAGEGGSRGQRVSHGQARRSLRIGRGVWSLATGWSSCVRHREPQGPAARTAPGPAEPGPFALPRDAPPPTPHNEGGTSCIKTKAPLRGPRLSTRPERRGPAGPGVRPPGCPAGPAGSSTRVSFQGSLSM